MARIRTIKPDFWTDEKLTECSLSARLLFIGTWNFADDSGNLDRSAKQIKARVFPLDNIDCEPLLQELITQGLLIEYSVSGKVYLHIQGFNKHQLINRPSKPTCPDYEDSLSIHVPLTLEGKGKEGKGVEQPIAKKPPTKNKTSLPKDFVVSVKVMEWAEKNGHGNLDEHLESFKLKCAAKNYQYIDWDSAFMNAIRDNWAKVESKPKEEDWYAKAKREGKVL